MPPRKPVVTIGAVLLVLFVYLLCDTTGTLELRRIHHWQYSYYASLGEGFLRGQLSMAHPVDPRLSQLRDPYDHAARETAGAKYLWDASYFRGRYYLYFSPVPLLLVYMPYRLTGFFPSDHIATLVFAVWAFGAATLFLWRALQPRIRDQQVPFGLWVLFAGLANVIPFTLTHLRVYEVAIMAATALTATWACTLLRFMRAPSPRTAAWMSTWLALAIATRPNLGVLLVIVAVALVQASRGREQLMKLAAAALAPLVVTAVSLGAYNFARFGNALEFGLRYQLTAISMDGVRACSLCTPSELLRMVNGIVHYLLWPPWFSSDFPFIVMRSARLDPSVSFALAAEQIIGIFVLVPLTLAGAISAVLLWRRGALRDEAVRTSVMVTAAAWLVMLALSTCMWVVARYSLDFMLLMTMAAAVCVEHGLQDLASRGSRVRPFRWAAVTLIAYSVTAGILLGFAGPGGSFARNNPELFSRLAAFFN